MSVLDATEESLEAGGVDQEPKFAALCELARQYAAAIDVGVAAGGQDATKALYLGPHLVKVMAEMGLSPTPVARRGPGRPPKESPAVESEEEPKDELSRARQRHARRRA